MPTEDFSEDFWKHGATAMLFFVIITSAFSISLFQIFSNIFIGFALISFFKSKPRPSFDKTFLAFLAVYFLMNVLSITQSDYLWTSLRGVFKVFRYLLLCLAVITIVDSEVKLKKIFQCFLFTALFIFLDAFIQQATGVEWLRGRQMTAYLGEVKRWTGPFRHANDFSAYLSFVLFLFVGILVEGKKFFSKSKLILFLIGLVSAVSCLIGTYSRGAWLAAGITLLGVALFKRSKALILIVAAAALWAFFFSPPAVKGRAASLFDFKNGTILERSELWSESLRMIEKKPWLGFGVNTYAKNEPNFKSGNPKIDNQYAHNGYLQIAAEIGVSGLLSFLAVLFYFFVTSFRAFIRASPSLSRAAGISLLFAIISFLIHSATDTNLQSVLLVNTLWLAIGITLSAKNCIQKSQT